jgi:hypothetical protein
VVTERMNKVCALLTGMFQKMKRSKSEGQAFVAGMDTSEKLHLTCVVIGVQGATNRHQMGILVNALRQQDEEKKFAAVGMALDVTFTDQKSGNKTDALYICLEDPAGNAEDVIFPYRKKLFGGFGLESPQSKPAEPRVYGPKGDELVGLIKNKTKTTNWEA